MLGRKINFFGLENFKQTYIDMFVCVHKLRESQELGPVRENICLIMNLIYTLCSFSRKKKSPKNTEDREVEMHLVCNSSFYLGKTGNDFLV